MNPAENQYDSVLVANIDIACSDVSVDITKVSNRVMDDQGIVVTDISDRQEEWNHADFFQVKYDGKPYSIAPGQTKHLPRFVAEHFAKHLADHLLQKMELATERKGLVQSPIERPKILKQILTELTETPIASTPITPEPILTKAVDTDPVLDEGLIPNPAIGVLKPEPPTLADLLKVAGEDPDKVDRVPIEDTSITDDKKPQPTRKQLIELCYQQSIDITGTENKAQLIEKLLKG